MAPMHPGRSTTSATSGHLRLAFTATLDMIVPGLRSVPPHAEVETVTVGGVGHNGMLLSRRVVGRIVAALPAAAAVGLRPTSHRHTTVAARRRRHRRHTGCGVPHPSGNRASLTAQNAGSGTHASAKSSAGATSAVGGSSRDRLSSNTPNERQVSTSEPNRLPTAGSRAVPPRAAR
jgi:hypothetical protein